LTLKLGTVTINHEQNIEVPRVWQTSTGAKYSQGLQLCVSGKSMESRAEGGKEGGEVIVLVVCEFSGVVRDAFRAAGHEAMSCDLLATEVPGPHYQGDCRDILDGEAWDLLIAHPDCTYLTCSAEWAYHTTSR
jgi:hypothetical protein